MSNPAKKTAPKARQRSGANVSSAEPSTGDRLRHAAAPVNVLVGEIVKHDDGAQVIAARAAEMDWTLTKLSDDDAPRIRDLDLAERLGFEQPRTIRQLIERWMAKTVDGKTPVISPASNRCAVQRFDKRGRARGPVEAVEYWLTEEEALFIASKSDTDRAVFVTKVMIAVFAAVMRGATVSRDSLPPEVTRLLADYRRELDAARSDIAAHKQENAALMALIGVSGKHRADQLKRLFNETASLNATAQHRSYRSCRTEVENLVRDRVGYPRGGAMSLEAMPSSVWEHARIYASQELARARRLSSISAQLSLGAA